ncbi:Arm DNA-binding domain-containing protein, partial [Halomonas vilamensis]
MTDKQKLTAAVLKQLAVDLSPGTKVWDSDLAGYHVLAGKRGLAFRLYYRTKTGKQRVLTLGQYGILTAHQARTNAVEALAIVAQGGDPRAVLEEARAEAQRQQQSLRAYLEGPYTAFQNRRKDGKGTLRRIEKDFSDWLDKPMGSLSRSDVERWQAKEEAAEKPRAFQTLKRSYDALQALLTHAAERNIIPVHPLKGVKLQKPALTGEELAEQGAERRFLEPEEVKALFAGLEAYQEEKRVQRRSSRVHGKVYLPDLDHVAYVDHVKPWILTMFYTGFRPGDLFGLQWEHV